jgi:endonuclease-3
MPRENLQEKRKRALTVMKRLAQHMPEAKIELDYGTPLQLLVAVVLSAQCTDKRVNMVTPALFQRFQTAEDYAGADVAELESYIRTCGLFRSKAKNLIAASRALVERYGGQVPTRRSELEELPGVGRKTAGVVAIHLGDDLAFPVDTHIKRLAKRLGFSNEAHPDKVERDLQKLLPSDGWALGHQLLIWHGRRTCFAVRPACERCVVNAHCPKLGVKAKPAKRTAPASAHRASS